MGDYQVLFSGDISPDSQTDTVQARLARALGIDDRKARALFSGRTVVLKSQLDEAEARALQERLAELGAICRIKSLAAPRAAAAQIDKDAQRLEGHHARTLKDITAAHVECPRCGHLQLEASHCSHCGIDIAAALSRQRKEDLLIEKKIRELRSRRATPPAREPAAAGGAAGEAPAAPVKRPGFVRSLFRRS